MKKSHNPYFNRWFSAMQKRGKKMKIQKKGHNPYFNRWFSAIQKMFNNYRLINMSQSLF